MKSQKYFCLVNIPEQNDFINSYHFFNSLIKTKEYQIVFDIIMNPESFMACSYATKLNLPAVAAIAYECDKAIKDLGSKNQLKQFIGAVVCSLMEANEYEKTGVKKSIPHKAFSRGEFYKKI